MNAPVPRRPNGTIMPGFTANAGGRPRSVIEELKSKYLRRLPELFENLFRLAAPNNPPMVQIAATKEILDRLIGKPQVTIDAVTTKVDVAGLYLAAMKRINSETQSADATAKVVETTPPNFHVLPNQDVVEIKASNISEK